MLILKVIYVVQIIYTLLYSSYSFSCTSFDSNMGATFDLTDLIRTSGQPPYTVEDGDLPCTIKVESNFTYMFNVCGPVSGTIPAACKNIDRVNSAGALQVYTKGTPSTEDDTCYNVGLYTDVTTKLTLLNQQDPSKGLSLVYYGSTCTNGDQRKFNMELICADRMSAVPTHALEYTHCSYTITIPSIYGCPLECPVANRHLCGGNGHCAYDEDKAAARCFCNHGFSGKDCSKTGSGSSSSSSYSPALLGLIITLFIIIIALIGSLFFMVRQISAYKEDLANYQVLKGSPEDDGPTAV